MPTKPPTSQFEAELYSPKQKGESDFWAFLLLPKSASETLPRRGRTSVEGQINGHPFQVRLEPDGQLSHWMKVSEELQASAGISPGDIVTVELSPVLEEPEPDLPQDLSDALAEAPEAHGTWEATTTIARVDWIHWIESAKQEKTRVKRVHSACDMLTKSKKRVCWFDSSGHYSKSLQAPKRADQ